MTWGKDEPRGYHHGNLREALITAALELIARKGASGLTFAEAARLAGVSPAAPYRHFRDRDELLAHVALRGFELFEAALSRAFDNARGGAAAALERLGKAYLGFAHAEPAYYAVMFESQVPMSALPALREASDRAFAVLRKAAEAIVADYPEKGRPPALMVALHLWTMAHGVAALFGRADASRRPLPMTAAELLEAQTLVYLRGLNAA